jgi:aspartyl-tRNA(Asn)/glutamyl-tRNA(Gln) amidotransferase subunit A
MVPLALGTDGGGSIRIPCGFCGLPGIKPTFGRVPAYPASPFGAVAHVGPMARTVEDLALLLDVIGRPDARDWQALPAPARSFRHGLGYGVAGLRIAFSPDLGHARVDPEVATLVERAASAFTELGAHVEPADPGVGDPRPIYDALWSAGAGKVVTAVSDTTGMDPGLLAVAAAGRSIPLAEYLAAFDARDALAIRLSRFLAEWDLLLTPALPIPAFAAGRDVPEGWPDPGWPSWTPFTYPFNLSQQPAAVVPCGFTAAGLPVGLQLVGARHADALVLRAARAYEAAHPQPTLAA